MTTSRTSRAPFRRSFQATMLLLLPGCAGMRPGPATPAEPALAPERFVLEGARATVQVVAGEVRVEPATGAALVVTVTRVGGDAARMRVERGGATSLRVLSDSRRLVYPGLPGRPDSVEFRVSGGGFKPGGGGLLGLFTGRSTKVVRPAGGGGAAAHADVRIELPAGRRLDLQLGAGRLVVGATAGEVHASTVGGAAEAVAPTGRVVISAHAGGISARGGAGELTLNSRAGAVDVGGFDGATLTVTTGAGTITGSGLTAASARFQAGAGDIDLERVRAARVEVRSGAGELRIRDARVDTLVARTEVGNVRLHGVQTTHPRVSTGKGSVVVDSAGEVSARR